MKSTDKSEKLDGLWERYISLSRRKRLSGTVAILGHLLLRGHRNAIWHIEITPPIGDIANPYSRMGFSYRSYKAGQSVGAKSLAMYAFNRNDLVQYRYWLARAFAQGDEYAGRELKRFEIRLPHGAAPKGRRRAYRRKPAWT